MGAGMFNIESRRHFRDLTPPTVMFYDWVHFGDLGIESAGPEFTQARLGAHRDAAAVSQAEFDAAYTATASGWYSTLTTATKAALRRSYL